MLREYMTVRKGFGVQFGRLTKLVEAQSNTIKALLNPQGAPARQIKFEALAMNAIIKLCILIERTGRAGDARALSVIGRSIC